MNYLIDYTKLNRENILIDFWGTLAESKLREKQWKDLFLNFNKDNIETQSFLKYWKERWFKLEITEEQFKEDIIYAFNLKKDYSEKIFNLINYKNITLKKGVLETLSLLKSRNYRIYLVSDCGLDTLKFVNISKLKDFFSWEFYSFKYKTTKDENLYKFVKEELGENCVMIGDNQKRDYEIPRRYGFDSILIKK
ncbi:HAD-IA family hydrolase [Candidatus Woesearchaeota archaeon]|nr:HAD-IA family hydrolase [Candidatus Woesearchaeota archaeon]